MANTNKCRRRLSNRLAKRLPPCNRSRHCCLGLRPVCRSRTSSRLFLEASSVVRVLTLLLSKLHQTMLPLASADEGLSYLCTICPSLGRRACEWCWPSSAERCACKIDVDHGRR